MSSITTMSSTSCSTPPHDPNDKNNAAPTPIKPTIITDFTKTDYVKNVQFDGTEASFYLWTTQILGFAETCNCGISVPPASAFISAADPAEHKLLQGRRATSTAMVLLRISLTDYISLDQLYTCKTPEIPTGSARKACLNLHKMFYPVSTKRMHELKNEFTMCILHRDDKIPSIWFAQLNKIRQELTDDYKLTTFEDTDVLQHIMYDTKLSMYKIILCISKDCLAHEMEQDAADNTFVFTVTLESVQEKLREKFAASKKTSTAGKSNLYYY
jgi:hypothetical protein